MAERFISTRIRAILALAASLLLTGAGPKPNVDVWTQYNSYTRAICPSRHIEWFPDDYDELLSGFVDSMPSEKQKLVSSNLDFSGPCSGETEGGSCEMLGHLRAFRRLHMLGSLAQYACHNWTCDYAAYCHRR